MQMEKSTSTSCQEGQASEARSYLIAACWQLLAYLFP